MNSPFLLFIIKKNPNLPNKEEVSEAVGVGSIVFYYLYNNRIKDINFIMEDALSFDGNTGPYVQYTYARTCSVLAKAGERTNAASKLTTPEEKELLKTLCRFRENTEAAIADSEPFYITRFILEVATAFNRFYHNCPILGADDADVKNTRLALKAATKTVLGNAFGLICLAKPEKV